MHERNYGAHFYCIFMAISRLFLIQKDLKPENMRISTLPCGLRPFLTIDEKYSGLIFIAILLQILGFSLFKRISCHDHPTTSSSVFRYVSVKNTF